MGPGKRFTPVQEEWIWKTSRAYRLMHRAALTCTARETTTFTARSLTSVSSNSLSPGIVNRRGLL